MSRAAFIGFGEVNTPIDIIINKCRLAEAGLKAEGIDLKRTLKRLGRLWKDKILTA